MAASVVRGDRLNCLSAHRTCYRSSTDIADKAADEPTMAEANDASQYRVVTTLDWRRRSRSRPARRKQEEAPPEHPLRLDPPLGCCWPARGAPYRVGHLLQLGVWLLHGRLWHPQTQGKQERFRRTLDLELLP